MFPSATDYFADSSCPYFDCGLCERPKCHFEHRKQDDAALRGVATRTVETVVESAWCEVKDEEALVRRVLELLRQRFPAHRAYFQPAPRYTPTPVARLSVANSPKQENKPCYSSAQKDRSHLSIHVPTTSYYGRPADTTSAQSRLYKALNLLPEADKEVEENTMALGEGQPDCLLRGNISSMRSNDTAGASCDLNEINEEFVDTRSEVSNGSKVRRYHKVNRKSHSNLIGVASAEEKCDFITTDPFCLSPSNGIEYSKNIFNPKIPKLPVMKKDLKESKTRIHDEHYCDSESSVSDIDDVLSEDAFTCLNDSVVSIVRDSQAGQPHWDPDVEDGSEALQRSPIHKIKRIALADAAERRPATHPLQKNRLTVNATQIMVERWKAREQATQNTKPRVKIAPVMNVPSLLKAKEELFLMQRKLSPAVVKVRDRDSLNNCLSENLLSSRPADKRKCSSLDSKSLPKRNTSSVAQSHGPKNARVAHTPHPGRTLIAPFVESKVPHTIRQKWLEKLFEVSFRLHSNKEVATEKAIAAEKEILGRMVSQKVYQSMAATAVYRLKKEAEGISKVSACLTYRDRLVGKIGKSIPENRGDCNYTNGLTLYESLAKYVLSEEELANNGFPLPHPSQEDSAYILESARRMAVGSPATKMQHCVFCRKEYEVDGDGYSVSQNDCEYHWGRIVYKRKPSDGCKTAYFSCCSRRGYERGCTSSRYHVTDTFDKSCLAGFVRTAVPRDATAQWGVFAVDCEMCYTTKGFELTRVSVVDAQLSVVYNALVLPDNPILNYNTQFSGIREDDLTQCTTRLADVQRDLLAMFNNKTILIGHSLGSDLTALRMLHATVVDTSVVFPHKHGPPMKRALRNLSLDFLSKLIQDQDSGHDSAEDAKTCMELMQWKIKQDAAKAGKTKKNLEQY